MELLWAALIALLFCLGDYYASHVQGGYTVTESMHTIRDMSAALCHTGVVAQGTVSIDRQLGILSGTTPVSRR